MGIYWATSEQSAKEFLDSHEERYKSRVERGETTQKYFPPPVRIVPFYTVKLRAPNGDTEVEFVYKNEMVNEELNISNRKELRIALKNARRADKKYGEQKSHKLESHTKRLRDFRKERKLNKQRRKSNR